MALEETDLEYNRLRPRLQPYVEDGLPESAAFLNWFLENYYRLEEVSARDAICDKPNDKGVDGIYVDDISEEIHILQVKLRQNDRDKGERDLKDLVATLTQFDDSEAVASLSRGSASEELKRLLRDQKIGDKIDVGYDVKGVYITNVNLDRNAKEFLAHNPSISIYTKSRLAKENVDINLPEGVKGEYHFTADEGYIEYSAGTKATMYLFPALATELVELEGLADQRLFSLNVRLSLGNTSVNKDIQKSLADSEQHVKFPLFHNGITLLAEKVRPDDEGVTVKNYVVVNGAQSLTSLLRNKDRITTDLKIILRIVEVGGDYQLAKQITTYSNNQNAIKPRDLRANHAIQTRLKGEFDKKYAGQYHFVIKQGEAKEKGRRIENDEAGRLLLAFDIEEPWNAHQIYRVFDDDYAKIFGRPQVTAERIIFVDKLSQIVESALGDVQDRKVASYRLTRYFLLYALRQVLAQSDFGRRLIADPARYLQHKRWPEIEGYVRSVVVGLVTDFEDDLNDSKDEFDYKAELKSPVRVPQLSRSLLRSYLRDLRRGRVDDPDELFRKL